MGFCSGTAHQRLAAGCHGSEAPTQVCVSGVVGAEAQGGGRKAPAPHPAWAGSARSPLRQNRALLLQGELPEAS